MEACGCRKRSPLRSTRWSRQRDSKMTAGVFEALTERLTAGGRQPYLAHGILVVDTPREALLATVGMLKSDFQFDLFLDVTAVDWPEREPRFDVLFLPYFSSP